MKNKISDLKDYGKTFKILYVEDNEDARGQTNKMLSNFYQDITLAVDGEDGLNKYLEFYEKNHLFYDLVITDINMPNKNGLEMSEEMLKRNSTQSIIITTAHNEIEFLTHAIDVGVSGFLVKPIGNTQLINVLHKTSLHISDRKFVELHVQQMEELTLKLEDQYNDAIKRNAELEKSLRVIDTMVHKKTMSQPKKIVQTEDEVSKENIIKDQVKYLINEDLHELTELHNEIDNVLIEILNNIESISSHDKEELITRFSKYAAILNHYSFFNELSREMLNFAHILEKEPLPQDKETVKNIFTLLESFIYVLGKWQKDLASGDESKLNSFDASITSDMKTISNMWSQEDAEIQNIFEF